MNLYTRLLAVGFVLCLFASPGSAATKKPGKSKEATAAAAETLIRQVKRAGRGETPKYRNQFRRRRQKMVSASTKSSKMRSHDEIHAGKKRMLETLRRKKNVAKKPFTLPRAKSTATAKVAAVTAGTAALTSEYYVADPLYFDSFDYVNNMDYQYWGYFQAPSDASYIYINFSLIDLETNYDYVYVVDANGDTCDTFTGYFSSGVDSASCAGNYAEIWVDTDSSQSGSNGYDGFTINGYTYGVEDINSEPVAIAVVDSFSKPLGQQFLFTGSQSYDPDSGDSIAEYEWDFGDGTYWSNSLNVYHTYTETGVYDVYLTVWDESGVSAWDYLQVEVTEPPVPTPNSFTATATGSKTISTTWGNPGGGVVGYSIQIAEGNAVNPDCDNGFDTGLVTSYNFSDLKAWTTYTIGICSYTNTAYSQMLTRTVSTFPGITAHQATPSNPSAAQNTSFQLTYNWSADAAPTQSYRVLVHFLSGNTVMFQDDHMPPTVTNTWDGNINYTRTITVPASLALGNYTIKIGLYPPTNPGLSARLWVRGGSGVSIDGEGRATVGTLSVVPAPPAAPTNLVATPGIRQVQLNWTDTSSTETGFGIYRRTDATSFVKIHDTAANATSYLNTPLVDGTKYYYEVRAFNAGGNSAPAAANATTLTPPAAPSNFRAVGGATVVNLTWTDNATGETGYSLYRRVGTGGAWTFLAYPAANSVSYADTSLAANTQYFYLLRSHNEVGTSVAVSAAAQTYDANGVGTRCWTGNEFLVWQRNFGRTGVTAGFNEGDFNRDGNVDAADYTVWRDKFGVCDSPDVSPAPVPTTTWCQINPTATNFRIANGSATNTNNTSIVNFVLPGDVSYLSVKVWQINVDDNNPKTWINGINALNVVEANSRNAYAMTNLTWDWTIYFRAGTNSVQGQVYNKTGPASLDLYLSGSYATFGSCGTLAAPYPAAAAAAMSAR